MTILQTETDTATNPAARASAPARRRELLAQLNTRISVPSRDLVDTIAARDGISIRAVVERALMQTYADAS